MATERDEERAAALGLPGTPYDWPEVFKYARGGKDGPYLVPSDPPQPDTVFDLADVERVEKAVEGDNEGPDWLAFGVLRDGRWFSISAGCDYTGWG